MNDFCDLKCTRLKCVGESMLLSLWRWILIWRCCPDLNYAPNLDYAPDYVFAHDYDYNSSM